jgi:hypothetical protein
MLVYKKNKCAIHLHVIPVMKCGCVFWEFSKRKLATRKDKDNQELVSQSWGEMRGACLPPNCSTNYLWQFLMEPVTQSVLTMNTRSSKEYRYIFTTTWKQESASHLSSRLTDNASGKLLIIFILSFRVANFLFENSQNTQPHFITGMKCKCIVLLFFL